VHETARDEGRFPTLSASSGQEPTGRRNGYGDSGHGRDGALRLSILGNLQASRDGIGLDLGPAKQRMVLSMLLLHANRAVSFADLGDALWSDDPPRTARKCIQVYVSLLRKILGQDTDEGVGPGADAARAYGLPRGSVAPRPHDTADVTVLSRPPGYELHVEAERVDALLFRALVREGRLAADTGDTAASADLLGRAIRLWRGPVLPEHAEVPAIAAEAARLRELYLSAYEDWAEAELALGHHAELLDGLNDVVREHPLRERLCHAEMTALFRCGRRSEALARFDAMRQLLAHELGLRPSPVLGRLYQAILSGDPGRGDLGAGSALGPSPDRDVAGGSVRGSRRDSVRGSGPDPARGLDPGSGPDPARGPGPGAYPSPSPSPRTAAIAYPELRGRLSTGPHSGPQLRRGPGGAVDGDLPTRGTAPDARPDTQPPGMPPTSRTGRPPSPGDRPVAEPAGIGRELAHFTGRAAAVDVLTGLFNASRRDATAVISGPAGIGKTALAAHCAHRLSELFPDGRVLVRLRGPDNGPRSTAEVLDELLCSLGPALVRTAAVAAAPGPESGPDPVAPPVSRPVFEPGPGRASALVAMSVPDPTPSAAEPLPGAGARSARLRLLTASRRTLIVLDDAVTDTQIRALLAAIGGSAVLVTTRRRLDTVEAAVHLALDPLPAEESVRLLRGLVGAERCDADPDGTERLAAACAGLPLALRIAAAKLAGLRHLTPARYAERLVDDRRTLDELEVGDLDVRSGMAASCAELRPAESTALRRLAAAGAAAGFTVDEAAEALGTDAARAEAVLEGLMRAHFVEVRQDEVQAHFDAAPVRFALPPLLRAYVRELGSA